MRFWIFFGPFFMATALFSLEVFPGQAFKVALPDQAWVYIGNEAEVRLVREFYDERSGETFFEFSMHAEAKGSYPLVFQLQNVFEGSFTSQTVWVNVGAKRSNKDLVFRLRGVSSNYMTPLDSGDPEGLNEIPSSKLALDQLSFAQVLEQTQRLETAGDFQGAWQFLQDQDFKDNSIWAKELARLSVITGRYEQGYQLYKGLAERYPAQRDEYLSLLIKLSMLTGANDDLFLYLRESIRKNLYPEERQYLIILSYLAHRPVAFSSFRIWAPLYSEIYQNAVYKDWYEYIMGAFLENMSPWQDFNGALSHYQRLVDVYPLSKFWKKADDRIRYLRFNLF